MKITKVFTLLAMTGLVFTGCNNADKKANVENPFFVKWDTPFEVPPFDKISSDCYMEAFSKGIDEQNANIAAIVNNKEAATFENTIVALELSGELLDKVQSVFFNMIETDRDSVMNTIAEQILPKLSNHSDNIMLNDALFARVKAVYESDEAAKLQGEDARLLKETFKSFEFGGANLSPESKEKLRAINTKLSELTFKFGKNLSEETNAFQLIIDNEADLDGLPEGVIAGAAQEAKAKGLDGKWLFTLAEPSRVPFLTYSTKRELREKVFKGYANRCNHDNEFDNKVVINEIVKARVEKAHLFGFKNYSEYLLQDRMAKNPENVFGLLDKLWASALPNAKKEVVEMQKIVDAEGGKFKIEAWDWWFYSEKVKQAKYSLDEEMLRPYFVLDNVRDGAFELAHRLFAVHFNEIKDIPVYNKEEVRAWEVTEEDGKHIGVLYMDFHPRESKSVGAWMTAFRTQSKAEGKNISPVISVVCNFSKPSGDKPALLSVDEVQTLFHEFGHALHGLLSNCKYRSLAGTSVATDFVELPSQVMENWALEPEVLSFYAKHYQTGEVIPAELVTKIQNSGLFNQGFMTVEYLAASLLDMYYSTISEVKDIDVLNFENDEMSKIGLIGEIIPRYRSTYFKHIFDGDPGYSSGYYSYIWAAVLDADAFQAFKETSLFDKATATSFRENVLSKGGTEEAMELYKKFRGREPQIEPLLKRRGLN